MLQKLIQKGEDENVDFKQTISNLYKIAKTIVSFANTKGGKLLIGVCDNKFIVGIDPEEEKHMLIQAAVFYCDPPVALSFQEEELKEEEKTVLIVEIQESNQKPHYAKQTSGTWLCYVRVKDKSIPAGKNLIKLMQIQQVPDLKGDVPKLSKHEKNLLNFLTINDSLTIKEVMKLQNFSKRRAVRIMTNLTNKNLIRMHEHQKEIFYTI